MLSSHEGSPGCRRGAPGSNIALCWNIPADRPPRAPGEPFCRHALGSNDGTSRAHTQDTFDFMQMFDIFGIGVAL